ncbi:MAG: YdcF family protein [Bosea sp. (in: a-proteobacteria)]
MFFVASKLFWFVAAPTNALLLVCMAGVVLSFTRWSRTSRALLVIGASGLILISATPFPKWILRPLEDRFAQNIDDKAPITGIIVLGGAVGSSRGQVRFTDAAGRMTEAARLAKLHPAAKLVFSGGSAQLTGPVTRTEADDAAQFFADMGLTGERVMFENQSRNTWENATQTAQLLAGKGLSPKPGERWLLVTSAYHIPRAMGVFTKAGLTVEAWPSDYYTSGSWRELLRPPHRWSWSFSLVDDTVKEWVGLMAYRMAGYTDEFLPAPRRR